MLMALLQWPVLAPLLRPNFLPISPTLELIHQRPLGAANQAQNEDNQWTTLVHNPSLPPIAKVTSHRRLVLEQATLTCITMS